MKILVSADHPGAANAVLPIVKKLKNKSENLTIVLGGKSINIFKSANLKFIKGDYLSSSGIDKLFEDDNYDIFLAGSSMGYTIDKRLLSLCQKNKVSSIYILDFWSNYWQRFSRVKKDFKYLPDYICIMDKTAEKEMITEGFPAQRLVVTGNPYFENFINGISKKNEDKRRILFVSQTLRAWQEGNEYRVLEDIISILLTLGNNYKLVIRLHPRDKKNKFNKLITENNSRGIKRGIKIFYDHLKNEKQSISRSHLIIGINSCLLFQAALAGKKVISYQPRLIKRDYLPSNKLGLSKLVTSKKNLGEVIKRELTKKNELNKKDKNKRIINTIINKKATTNIINLVYSLEK